MGVAAPATELEPIATSLAAVAVVWTMPPPPSAIAPVPFA